MSKQLEGKTAVITGASSGIGQAIAELFGAEGAHVFLIGRTQEPMEQTSRQIEEAGGRATVGVFDIRDLSRLQAFIEEAYEQTGRLDILVNNAGVLFQDPILNANPEDWRNTLETNILAVLTGSQAAVRTMRQSGRPGDIVTISSIAVQRFDSGVYGATKHAVNVIMTSLRKELENDPIRVTTIMPAATATNIARNFQPAVLKYALGVEDLPFDHQRGRRMPEGFIEQVQPARSQYLSHPLDVARAALFAVTQPQEVGIAELVVRAPKALII